MSFVQDLYVNNTLNVTGLSTHSGNMAVSGTSTLTGDVTMSSNAIIVGNLNVQGTTTSIDSVNVNIKDRHLYLNKDYTVGSGKTGGLVVNYLPTATTDTVGSGGFSSTSLVVISNSGTFTAGDIIQISGADNVANNGLFVVASNSETNLVIDTMSDFAQTAFVVDAGSGGTIAKVEISIIQTDTTGAWETTFGSTTMDITNNSKSIILAGGASSNTALTLTNSANQIVFSHAESGRTDSATTLHVVEPSSARVITLPDPVVDANIILSEGTQNMSGAYTVASGGSLTIDTAASLNLDDTAGNHTYTFEVSELEADRVITLPILTDSDTFVFENHVQTLTNKTILEVVKDYTGAGAHVLGTDGGRVNTVTHTAVSNVTLPTTPPNGTKYTIVNTAATNQDVIITAGGSDTIDNLVLTSLTLSVKGQRVTLQYLSTTTNWYIV
jgi:hypothetical protein